MRAWHTIAVFRDGAEYQWRWFSDERGCGMEYRIKTPNAESEAQ